MEVPTHFCVLFHICKTHPFGSPPPPHHFYNPPTHVAWLPHFRTHVWSGYFLFTLLVFITSQSFLVPGVACRERVVRRRTAVGSNSTHVLLSSWLQRPAGFDLCLPVLMLFFFMNPGIPCKRLTGILDLSLLILSGLDPRTKSESLLAEGSTAAKEPVLVMIGTDKADTLASSSMARAWATTVWFLSGSFQSVGLPASFLSARFRVFNPNFRPNLQATNPSHPN